MTDQTYINIFDLPNMQEKCSLKTIAAKLDITPAYLAKLIKNEVHPSKKLAKKIVDLAGPQSGLRIEHLTRKRD